MIKLTPEEKEFIYRREQDIGEFMKGVCAARSFKLGDYLVAYHYYDEQVVMPKPPDQLILNSYGLPKKFKVVFVDKNSIPYIKELNKNGKPYGRLLCLVTIGDSEGDDDVVYQVDPDYEDSIIFGDSKDYSATATHKEKAATFKDITQHNKQNKLKNNDMNDIVSFIGSLIVGSTFWRSNNNAWTVTKIKPIPRDKTNRINNSDPFMEVQDSKGRLISVSFWDFKNKSIYKARPRTYRELRNT